MSNKLEVTTSNKIDMNINKDDLIDILMDEQLSLLEKEVEDKELTYKKLSENNPQIKSKEKFDKTLLKHIPKELSKIPLVTINYVTGYSNAHITFIFDKFSVSVQNISTVISNTDKEKLEQANYNKLKNDLANNINELKNNIANFSKSSKRMKARMLKKFLNNSEEGKSILSLISKSDIKLLN